MSSSQPPQQPPKAPTACALVKPTGLNLDPAWEYNSLKNINKKASVTCDFCGHESHGGITRAREHQLHIKGNVQPCKSIPKAIRLAMAAAHEKKIAEANAHLVELNEDDDAQDDVEEIYDIRVGKQHVNYVLAGKKLMARRQKLFWTPCAAHCVDLMLEEIGNIPKVKRVCKRGVTIVGFIYNHTMTLNLMRKFTNKVELVRSGVTRFATNFLTLQRLYNQRNNIRTMFTSAEWLALSISKDAKGKAVRDIIYMQTFWNDVLYTLKAMGPLVQVLRLVDNERKPAMGYIYEAMDRAKETMMKSFLGNEEKYKPIFEIIDRRWDVQLHHPLHAAGHFLNPQYYFADPSIDTNGEINEGLLEVIEKLSIDQEDEDRATTELAVYRRSEGLFNLKAAIRNRTNMAPAEWWRTYGTKVGSLQRIAIRVLSLTCSSSGCERNWSTFEQIHSKKRNRLEHQRLQDLVYIKYNQKLNERFDSRDLIDPIVLNDIDLSNEWLVGEMDEAEVGEQDVVFEGESLTWEQAAEAAGAGEPQYMTRQQRRNVEAAHPTTQDMEIDEEEDVEQIDEDDNEKRLEDDYEVEMLEDSD